MSPESRPEDIQCVGVAADLAVVRRPSSRGGLVMLAMSLGGLVVAHQVAIGSSDPSALRTEMVTAALVTASLASMGLAISRMVTTAESRLRHVFCSSHVFGAGLFLVVLAAVVGASMLLRDPFHELTSRGRVTAGEIVDTGSIVGVVMSLVGAGVAFVGALDARHDEHHWSESIALRR